MNFMYCAHFTYRRKLLKVLFGTDFILILYSFKKVLLFQISKEEATNEQNREVKGLLEAE